ncbi:hypothetical protein HN419_04970 [Candidatus Woesearchaeota archaeon]|jgi:hypothetical protein|nr:hypothetical protein [Candidatus Woesearchaeota archaeon]MBT3537771.1 hypothetical protein [Candidatus Woesearchaeota archaeon]MBT4697902.1 hypothetical protein [Candidatus Woesearchaeota archaeon]MBT4717265.1 hypothetical protein [Candidatus Woesearchaeota archaeon]MBT7105440.1 hypothetical protein [Candidatus Woesearchaeota archaeon]
MRKYYKIGSLSLSVNAIVVLVLGITMLGLGLAFTKGMFGKLAGKIEIPPPNIPATASEPIVLPGDDIAINGNDGKSSIFSVNAYHDGTCSADDNKVKLTFSAASGCVGFAATPTAAELAVTTQKIPEDQFRTYKIVATPTVAMAGSCLISITSECDGAGGKLSSKQITLKPE